MFGTGKTAFDTVTGESYDLIENEKDLKVLMAMLSGNILGKQKTIERLRAEINKMEEDTYKDSELQKMKTQYDEMREDYYRGFPISEKEANAIREWKKSHDATEHQNPKGYHGVSGGGYSYNFYPTAIGTSGVCICGACRRNALNHACKTGEYDSDAYTWYMKEHNGEFEFQELG